MAHVSNPPIWTDPHNWQYGPAFDIQVRLSPRLARLSPELARRLPEAAGLRWYDFKLATIDSTGDTQDWRDCERRLALWDLGLPVELGVKVIPRRNVPYDMLLSIPPRFVRAAIGVYPWMDDEALTLPATVDFHLRIADRLKALHSVVSLQAALLQDEAWTKSLSETDEGILIRREVAAAAGFDPGEDDFWTALPF